MSVNNSPTDAASSTETPETPGSPALRQCASYMGCRHCKEGALVYDPDAGASRCRSCGKLD